jgi:ATP-dependent RNA helicase DOB1
MKMSTLILVVLKELSGPLRTMQEMARKIAQTSMEAKIDLNIDDYVSKFKPFMMDVVFEWCKGQPFVNICKMTDLFEGTFNAPQSLNSTEN